jgi:xylulokinase
MASESTLVGLDVGTSGVKAIAISPAGQVLARAEEGYPLSTPRPGWAEQDPEDWWRATESVVAMLRTAAPAEFRGIAAVGLSALMTVVGTLLPTLRALRVDPITALRAE